MSKWTKFTDQMEYSGEPSAKVYKSGKVRFNNIAGDLWFTDCDKVEILISDTDEELAFRPAARDKESTWSYNRDGDGNGGNVSIRSVLTKYGIWHERMDESMSVPIRYDEDAEAVVIDLSEVVERFGVPSPDSVARKKGNSTSSSEPQADENATGGSE